MNRIRFLVALLFVILLSDTVASQYLSPIDINQRLIEKYHSNLERFTVLPGTTPANVVEYGIAGFRDAMKSGSFVLIWGSDSLCEINVVDRELVKLNAAKLANIAGELHNFDPGLRCKGDLFFDADTMPHLFIRFSPELRSGVWISASGSVPARHMPEAGFPEIVARTLIRMSPSPVLLITAAPDRAAYLAEADVMHILLFSLTSRELKDLEVCAHALTLPLFSEAPFSHFTSLEELTFHAVHFRGEIDLLAYIICLKEK